MLRRLVTVGIVITSVVGVARAFPIISSPEGPIASVTGAPEVGGVLEEPTCMLCHSNDTGSNLNPPGGSIEILDLPSHYAPGGIYPLRVRLSSSLTAGDPSPEWGFELTAVRGSDGASSGAFILPADGTLQEKNGSFATPWVNRRYVLHTKSGIHPGEASPVEWAFDWQAPTTQVETVYFFVAGNSANGDGTLTGDWIFTGGTSIAPEVVPVASSSWGRVKSLYR